MRKSEFKKIIKECIVEMVEEKPRKNKLLGLVREATMDQTIPQSGIIRNKTLYKQALNKKQTFIDCKFENCINRGATIKGSKTIWFDGTWNDGTWQNGTWKDGTWKDGTWKSGIWNDGVWYNGTWQNGIWDDGVWKNGIWWYGTWQDGAWYNGTWQNGTWKNGFWKNGTWKNGTWQDGTWQNGKIKGKQSKVSPEVFYYNKLG